MNRIIFYIVLGCLFLASCSEQELSFYHGANYIHFTPDNDKLQIQVFNFATDAPLATEATVEVKMSMWGYFLNQDATCFISPVEKQSTAIENINYKSLENGIFKSNIESGVYPVTVYRNAELMATDFVLTIHLDSVENCNVGPADYSYMQIQVKDELTQPVWWKQSSAANLGDFYPIKYRLFIIFMNGEILESLDKYTGIQFQNLIEAFRVWWIEKWDEGQYQYYLEDGTTPMYESIVQKS